MGLQNEKMIHDWLECYQSKKELEEPLDAAILSECSAVHYRHLNIDQLLDKYMGDLDGFIEFLNLSWGWIIEKVHKDNIIEIFVDENKDFCVCPLVSEKVIKSPSLCECSRAFNKRMFEKVTGTSVDVSLGKTYLRDKKSCEYIIRIAR